ncbi:ankyrin repeat domain-containing protein [Endozoicomonas sp. GU-1]|uniref:ankyrin repeat domain-containing protein n=1 Tax=Endozoicomonas sp. GU-1 TaxID=3009078 RepID=UPI0022B3C4DF|nr:ankyrin repeat domain-containing protein [Endozoicomonas sp. GU-1]WBA81339.1 ankyrin repeat domain-containing protein [Endozoicomonas sp. GU-1]WBA84285.1 ankyrin repeat domain-containing protein [Endozoicomonas sp. GU-1]
MNNVDMSKVPTVRFNLEVGGNDEDNEGKFNGHSLVKTAAPQKCISKEPGDGQQKLISLNQRGCADKQPALPIDPGSSSVIDGKSTDQKTNNPGETPLHTAERQRSTNVLQILKKNDEFSEGMVNTAREGNAERLQRLISNRPFQSTLNNALKEAVKSGQNHCLEILIKAGAKNLDDALLAAAAQGQAHCLHPLISTDKVEVLNMALCEAARHGQTQCLKPLINQGANDLNGALCAAVEQGQSKSLQLLIKEGGKKLNLNDALYFAVLKENDEFRDALINNGADITTVLRTAAVKDSVERLNDQFISAYINTPNKYGRTPLHITAELGYTKSLEKLLKTGGVNINFTDEYGNTALHFAVYNNRTDTAMMLLKADNIDVNVKDKIPCTALHYTLFNYDEADGKIVMEELLKTSDIAVVNQRGKGGWTPLHVAANRNIPDAVRQLLAIKDIKVNQKDDDGNTALHIAAMRGHTEIVEIFLDAAVGIDVKAKNNKGRKAQYYADDDCRKLLKDFLKANKH